MLRADGNEEKAARYIRNKWPRDEAALDLITRAAVTPMDSTVSLGSSDAATDFIALVRPRTIIGQLRGVRRALMNTRTAKFNTGGTGAWAQEGAGTPISAASLETVTLGPSKIVCAMIITQEVAKSDTPDAVAALRDDLAAAVIAYSDKAFIDPSIAAGASSPASITHNSPNIINSTGSTPSALATNTAAALDLMAAQGSNLANVVAVAHPRVVITLATLRDSAGAPAFPGVKLDGSGDFCGMPIIASVSAPYSVSGGGILAFVDPTMLLIADNLGVSLEVTTQTSVQLSDTPTSAATTLTSLWQNNFVALRALRYLNFMATNTGTVAFIDGVR
jgi:HK97 family phage major capsid protein